MPRSRTSHAARPGAMIAAPRASATASWTRSWRRSAGPAPRRVHGLDPTRRNPSLPREVVQGIFEWAHGYATVEDAAWVARIPYLLCVGGWTHATIVTDPHRGALEQDRCEAEIAALKAKRPSSSSSSGARARGNGSARAEGGASTEHRTLQNLEHAPAVVRARDAASSRTPRGWTPRGPTSSRAGAGPWREMLTKDKKGADCVPPRKGPRAPSSRRTRPVYYLPAS